MAATNDRLRAMEREQAALNSELSAAHGRLAEQGRRFELLFDAQEAERTVLAHELHDQSAQALSAIHSGCAPSSATSAPNSAARTPSTCANALGRRSGRLRQLAVGCGRRHWISSA